MTEVILVPVLSDNYSYILKSDNHVAVIDPGEAAPIIKKLEELNLKPDFILNTHHHGDHIDGNAALTSKYGSKLIGPQKETSRIDKIDKGVSENDIFQIGSEEIHVFETPGHTTGHICFWLPHSKILFSGDLLFAMGCGRAFEGTAEDLFHSIAKIKDLPSDTKIYCGHEYTLANAEFSITVDQDNNDLQSRYEEVKAARNKGIPTIPTSMEIERKTNPFLRAETAEELSKIRALKDSF